MSERVLITGGAGFIGSHLVAELLSAGYRVRVLDNLHSQVHENSGRPPPHLPPEVEFCKGDVRDRRVVRNALAGAHAVLHLAARVGVGQSMYRVEDYVSVNDLGTAVLLEEIARSRVGALVVASSMSIYGEGLYRDEEGRPARVRPRTRRQLERGEWEPRGGGGRPVTPAPTPESKRPELASMYALTKFSQERMCLIAGRAYDVRTVALRFFNVYGSGQALSNPYTGVLAIFASRLLNGRPPLIFEDGLQRRDFVHVRDVARACRLALEKEEAAGHAYNVGSGTGRSILQVARALALALGKADVEPEIPGRSRVGDIRHCIADLSLARERLGFEPATPFEEGLRELAEWLRSQTARDRMSLAAAELDARGLTIGANGLPPRHSSNRRRRPSLERREDTPP